MNHDKYSYEDILNNLYDGLYFVDLNRVIVYWNKAAEQISGYSADNVIGKSCRDNILVHVDENGKSLCSSMCPLAFTMEDGKPRQAQVFLHHKDGHRIPVSVRASCLINEDGETIGGVELFSDTSSTRLIEMRVKELEEMALIDNLTRLANRNAVQREFFMRFEEYKRFGISFGVLYIDIDFFKKINDRYGHDLGDRTLKLVADTLVHNIRPFDVIGRWGGEEFIGIIRNVSRRQLKDLGERLRHLIANSYITLEEDKVQISISLGATLVLENDSIDSIIQRADTLLYESKRTGRNRLTMG